MTLCADSMTILLSHGDVSVGFVTKDNDVLRYTVGGVGRRRGAGCPALFRRPHPKHSMRLSSHCAFQYLPPAGTGDVVAVMAIRISRTSLPLHRRYLCPFAL